MKTANLIGPALDWAVAKCEGGLYQAPSVRDSFWIWPGEPVKYSKCAPDYSTDWAQGGPIIERELLAPEPELDHNCKCFRWCCRNWTGDGGWLYGPTPLIAAMRCYVASKLGDEVEIPEELK